MDKNRGRILVTGGAGFIGHHFVEHLLKNTGWDVVVLDRLNYASSGFDRLRDVEVFDDKRAHIFAADFTQPLGEGLMKEIGQVDYIVHLGAETHVDRSIENPEPFVMANVVGTMRMLDFARKQKDLKKFVYFSTDEVFGPAPQGVDYKEWDRYNSTNPYAAAKAGGEELSLAYANTYRVPVIVTHTMNAFGERQHPEKFIPKIINKVLAGETVTIHADPTRQRAGSRFWIHARNIAAAILFLLEKGEFRDKYNIVGERELDNLSMARYVAAALGKELKYELVDFHSSRPGHDLRYSLDGSKMKAMGWEIPKTFEDSLSRTVGWYFLKPERMRWLQVNQA
jgi:dTDP-glucose 4,6-dehydratase